MLYNTVVQADAQVLPGAVSWQLMVALTCQRDERHEDCRRDGPCRWGCHGHGRVLDQSEAHSWVAVSRSQSWGSRCNASSVPRRGTAPVLRR